MEPGLVMLKIVVFFGFGIAVFAYRSETMWHLREEATLSSLYK